MRFSTGNRMASILLFILISASRGKSGHPCPSKNLNSTHCSCTEIPSNEELVKTMNGLEIPNNNTFFTQVECENLTSYQTIQYIVRSELNRMLIDKLIIHKLLPGKIDETKTEILIKGGLFENSRIRQFEVRDSVLHNNFIDLESPFSGEEHCLISFAAINCSLQGILSYDLSFTITTKGFSSLTKLEAIDFSMNRIIRIDKSAFQNPPEKLRELNLSSNSIEEIDKKAFARIRRLEVLDLSHNILHNVERDLFSSPISTIQVLDLSWNSIETLPEDLFDGMPSLRIVKMEKNFLFSLAVKPWQTVWDHLSQVYLMGNFIECDCKMTWLLQGSNDSIKTATGDTNSTTAIPEMTGRALNRTANSGPNTNSAVLGNDIVDLKGDCYVSIDKRPVKQTLVNQELYAALQVLLEICPDDTSSR